MWRGALCSSKLSSFSKPYLRNFSSEIFVSSLSHYTTEDDLKNMFLQFGEIREVRLVRDQRTQRPKGYGFVRFESDKAAEQAVKDMDKRLGCQKMDFSISEREINYIRLAQPEYIIFMEAL